MKTAILGDVHGNLEALTTAVEAALALGAERFVQVGDIVGYGADPVACIELLVELKTTIVAGNHDWAVVEKLSPDFFNPAARAAVLWTRNHLEKRHLHFLEDLPLIEQVDDLTVFHASLDHPELFHYILDPQAAFTNLELLPTRLGCCGHSHVPVAFLAGDELVITDEESIAYGPWQRAIFNVGSVGQPRDGDRRTAFAMWDSQAETYELIRVEYDIEKTAAKIQAAGLPVELAERLKEGL